jgi:hypothetical protein
MTRLTARSTTAPRLATRGWLTAALVLVVTGCGSGHEASPVDAVGDTFAAKALSACAAAQESKDGWSAFPVSGFDPTRPEVAQLPKAGAWLADEVAPTFDAWLDDLTALGEPPTGRSSWTEVLTLVGRIAQLNRAQVAAAKDADTRAFAAATDALRDLQPELKRATTAAGVGPCAEVHAG